MNSLHSEFSVSGFKAQAKELRASLNKDGDTIGHSQCLELIAKQNGFKDWNTLSAACLAASNSLPVIVGDHVRGQYLGQDFSAKILSVNELPHSQYKIVMHLDEAVDVVTFDSFSAFRQRIQATIGADGISLNKTSNGEPQLRLALRPKGNHHGR